MSNSSLRKIMLRVNKTFFESRSLKGLADGGGPVFVTSETRKRLSADQRRENAETRGPLGLIFPKQVASRVVCLC